ncbi:outer membrane protein assembly factor BamB family protein [Rubripirellula reticaptiva]|uniref:Outer membrane protein assembly factor BamB n=1 Tax=Rubripirellula reticaptiva TaxID=2528013 RepID=A0A5C6F8C0_9BACT|nr:PQQ-binding-like beta-propeller repeat protein [Rubripirellula reticaptiva]TWU57172.1 Outer membrane protein assembly factor BamB precursor [Rubripirellula reticaptiva]
MKLSPRNIFPATALQMQRTVRIVGLFALSVLWISASPKFASADWPYWRGPQFDGTAVASGLPDDWDPDGGEGSNVIWSRDDIGGPCTPVVMNHRLYTIQRADAGTPREAERVVCLDAKTGETIWENRYNVWLSDVPAERIGWSSVVADPDSGNIYALGSCDIFMCINGETGETVWSIPLHEQYGMLSTYGGRTNFPVVHEDLVIISGIIINWGEKAKPNHRLLAMDKLTGELRWFSGTRDLPYDTTYSAPSIVTVDGQRQLVIGGGDGAIWGFQPRTGKPLWHYDLSMRGIFATPLVVGNKVFASHSEENVSPSNNVMGGVVGLEITGTGDNTKVKELWKQLEVVSGYSEPVMIGNRLYLVDDRCKMWIFDAETGEAIVEQESFVGSRQRAALLHADGKIYVLTENGRWATVKPTEDGFEVLNKGRVRGVGFAGSPIVSDGRLYFPSSKTLYCVGTENGKQESVTMSESMGAETPVSENTSVAWVQLVPTESLVKPGESVELKVNYFNSLGQAVQNTNGDVTFSVEGPGSISGTTFTASSDASHTGAVITAKVGDVTGEARVRIVPPLPWKFTFDGLQDPPLSWVGARYRHIIKEVDGSPALTKITTIPKGARSRAWMGPSDLAEYTIAADAMGKRMSDQLPDIGLTNHGYVLDLMGESQQLQIRTWSAQLRMAETIDFPWKENTWYRMKFRADIESEPPAAVAVLRGKVWPKDEPEPKEWTITARDESPNLNASPGLYGNAKVAELYLDNIEVSANTDQP